MADTSAMVRFPRATRESFRTTLTKRVKQYFEDNDLSSKANAQMVWKTIGMLSLYFIPYLFLILGNPGVLGVFILFFIMGLGMSGIGMGVMHDAVHGAYHNKSDPMFHPQL